ncbi:MAG: oligopeptide transporter, OPT family [Sedimentisphaerales bacterium]|nr:oligopeptide transporter, OPT family [Sedimentisphaerales bacterium]
MDLQEKSLPEVTIKAFVLGMVLSMILGAANAYLGLFAGMTVSASIPASVLSMGFLRLFRKSNILENNNAQTAASSGEAIAAGTIFTLPALIILGVWNGFSYGWVTIIAVFGGALGVLFTIPLRRSLIVEKKLSYPEGIATAEVLKTGQKGGRGVLCIAKAAIASGLFKAGAGALGLWPEAVEGAKALGGSLLYFGSNLSPALLSVGYIVGLNIAVLIFLGGACNWFVAIPICAVLSGRPEGIESSVDWAYQIWRSQTRYIGVGAMLVGGLWTIFNIRASLLSGITSGLSAYRGSTKIARTERDIPMKWVLASIVASVVPLFLLYQAFVGDVRISAAMAVIMLITGFIFSAVAGYMAGLVGSSNNPISGVTIATVLTSSLILFLLMGKDAPNGPAAAIIVGSVICCAAAIAGDNMQDLKTGYILGATPWKQQLVNLAGTIAGALVLAPVMTLLQKAYGFAGQPGAGPKALSAPQANLMASVAKGVFKGELPWNFIYIGMAVAVGIIALDLYLQKKGSAFRTPILAVAIGFYLPLELSVPIFAGGLIHYAVGKFHSRRKTAAEQVEESSRNGLLFASGLITGEALMGIFLAIPIILLKRLDISLPLFYIDDVIGKVLSLLGITLPLTLPVGALLGTVLLIGVAYWLYRSALGEKRRI